MHSLQQSRIMNSIPISFKQAGNRLCFSMILVSMQTSCIKLSQDLISRTRECCIKLCATFHAGIRHAVCTGSTGSPRAVSEVCSPCHLLRLSPTELSLLCFNIHQKRSFGDSSFDRRLTQLLLEPWPPAHHQPFAHLSWSCGSCNHMC